MTGELPNVPAKAGTQTRLEEPLLAQRRTGLLPSQEHIL